MNTVIAEINQSVNHSLGKNGFYKITLRNAL
jgi:hypothetical protein